MSEKPFWVKYKECSKKKGTFIFDALKDVNIKNKTSADAWQAENNIDEALMNHDFVNIKLCSKVLPEGGL